MQPYRVAAPPTAARILKRFTSIADVLDQEAVVVARTASPHYRPRAATISAAASMLMEFTQQLAQMHAGLPRRRQFILSQEEYS